MDEENQLDYFAQFNNETVKCHYMHCPGYKRKEIPLILDIGGYWHLRCIISEIFESKEKNGST